MRSATLPPALLLLAAAAPRAAAQITDASYWSGGISRFGEAIASLGDVDGDGTDELFVGEPHYDSGGGPHAGRAYVIETTDLHYWIHLIDGTQKAAEFGSAGCSLGDVDGDGYGDFAIGARLWDTASHTDAGMVTGYSGRDGSIFFTLEGGADDEQLGADLAWLGDVDGDGLEEFAASRPTDGQVVVYDGKGNEKYVIKRGPNTEFAAAIARCDDLDNDGFADVIVGEPGYDQFFPPLLDCGRAVAYSGIDGSYLTDVHGVVAGERLGSSVSGCGDVDDDGFGDFLTGAMETDNGYTDNGSVSLWSGATFLELQKVYGEEDGDFFGFVVAGLGDLDQDGVEDFAASAKEGGSGDQGLVGVWSGATGQRLYFWEAVSYPPTPGGSFSELGAAICAGDWNGDAIADLAWGDPTYAFAPWGTLDVTGLCNTFVGCPAWARDYGAGWPGRNGIPTLTAQAPPQLGSPIDVDVSNSLGSATLALVMVGTQTAANPYKGGLLLTNGDLLSLIFPLDAGGTTLSDDIPFDVSLLWADFYVQVLEADPFASKKISMTAGLHLRVGIPLE